MLPLQQTIFVSMFCEAILHGAYSVLAGGTLYLLMRKPRMQRMERTNLIMVALTVLMYGLSTVHIALAMRVDFVAFFDEHAIDGTGTGTIFNNNADPRVWMQVVLEIANYLIGDGIVCWRTWVLWNRNYRVLVIPAWCIIGIFTSGIGMVVSMARSPPGTELYSGSTVLWFGFVGGLGCLNTLYSICMMYCRLRTNIRFLKAVQTPNVSLAYHSVVSLVIESGAVYLLALVILLVLFLAENNGVYVIADMLTHLTGIYPTVIIVMINLRITFHNNMMARMFETTSDMEGALRKDGGSMPVESHALQHRPAGIFTWRVTKDMGEDTYPNDSSSSANATKPIQISVNTEEIAWIDPQETRRRGVDLEKA